VIQWAFESQTLGNPFSREKKKKKGRGKKRVLDLGKDRPTPPRNFPIFGAKDAL
jgi:hypothetical protein